MAAEAAGDRLRAVTFPDLATGHERVVEAGFVIDASETGELLPLAGVEHVLGAESRADTGELHAVDGPANPLDQQALTWCMALSHYPGEDHRIDKPEGYEAFRDFRPSFWPGPLFGWTVSNHVTHEPLERPLFAGDSDAPTLFDLWHARRIAWRRSFEDGAYESDITIANWPQMDYWWRPALGVPEQDRQRALDECRRCSLSFLYWMQTEAPRHDGGQGYPGLRPRGDVLGTHDGLAQNVYWREGYRIVPEQRLLEQHIGVAARPGATAAEAFADSVAIGAYRIDLHASTVGDRDTVDIDYFPFQIPIGALLPVRVENLLPACKNLGSSSHHQRRGPRATRWNGVSARRAVRWWPFHSPGRAAARRSCQSGPAGGVPGNTGWFGGTHRLAELRRADAAHADRLPAAIPASLSG
ncbi:FAD-dependent oxidoreductase [Roseomonas sp. GCM10028921]